MKLVFFDFRDYPKRTEIKDDVAYLHTFVLCDEKGHDNGEWYIFNGDSVELAAHNKRLTEDHKKFIVEKVKLLQPDTQITFIDNDQMDYCNLYKNTCISSEASFPYHKLNAVLIA